MPTAAAESPPPPSESDRPQALSSSATAAVAPSTRTALPRGRMTSPWGLAPDAAARRRCGGRVRPVGRRGSPARGDAAYQRGQAAGDAGAEEEQDEQQHDPGDQVRAPRADLVGQVGDQDVEG